MDISPLPSYVCKRTDQSVPILIVTYYSPPPEQTLFCQQEAKVTSEKFCSRIVHMRQKYVAPPLPGVTERLKNYSKFK